MKLVQLDYIIEILVELTIEELKEMVQFVFGGTEEVVDDVAR